MTLTELSHEYRESGLLCRERMKELNQKLETEKLGSTEQMRIRRRIATLSTMARDTIATSKYLENYYGDDANEQIKAEYVC